MSTLTQRTGAGASKNPDPFAVLDEEPEGSAAPIDAAEQKAIVQEIKERNDAADYWARALMLVLLGGVAFLYLTPLPAYLTNSHPDTHFHMLFVGVHREPTHDDVTKLPIAPIYCFFVAIMTSFLWAAAIETADRMGLTKRKGLPFPHQPHLFGTAPNWLIRTLTDLRWHPSNSGGVPSARSDLPRQQGGDNPPNFLTKMHPRNLYLFVILLASTPLPLMVFGAGGSGETTLWWTLTPLVIGTLLTIEGMIHRSQRDAASLDGMRYNYKGA